MSASSNTPSRVFPANCSRAVTTVPTFSGTQFWHIKNFNSLPHKVGEFLMSPDFYVHGSGDDPNVEGTLRQYIFSVKLYPRADRVEDKAFASVFLSMTVDTDKKYQESLGDTKNCDVLFTISVGKGENGCELAKFKLNHSYKLPSSPYGVPKSFSRNVVGVNKQLLDDELTITCNVTCFAKPVTVDITPKPAITSVMSGKNNNTVDMLPLYNDGLLTDVDLFVGSLRDKCVIKAHKLILAWKSPMFRKMFTSEFMEADSNEVSIPDISVETFKLVLVHMYGGELPTGLEMARVEELLYASEKYELSALKALCQNLLSSMINCDTVVSLLLLSDKYNGDTLKRACHAFVRNHWKEVMDKPGWDTLMLHHANVLQKYSESATTTDNDCSGPEMKRQKK